MTTYRNFINGEWIESESTRTVENVNPANTMRLVDALIARLLQAPWEPAETTLVLIGEEGTGKNVFGRAVAELILDHYFYADDIEDLVARFNEPGGVVANGPSRPFGRSVTMPVTVNVTRGSAV